MNGESWFEFEPGVFVRVFVATMSIAAVGLLIAGWVFGPVCPRDLIGTMISALIFSYVAHLWLLP